MTVIWTGKKGEADMDFRNLCRISALCLLLASCGGGGGGSDGNTGSFSGGSGSGGTGGSGGSGGSGGGAAKDSTLSLSITDAPVHDALKVEVNFSGVEIKPKDGSAVTYSICKDPTDGSNPPIIEQGDCSASAPSFVTIDLLQQTAGASYLLLDQVDAPPGEVNWVRLTLTDPAGKITLSSGAEHPLTVPSGNQTGLKINRGFTVPEAGEARIVIDFDVRKSVIRTGKNYKLKPTLRLVEKFGAIQGMVATALRPPGCLGPSVYVFEGANATPDDIDGDEGDPVSSASVDEFGYYRADFLESGIYTLAFVCAGGTDTEPADDAEKEDTLGFKRAKPFSSAIVVNDQTIGINFPEVIPF
jgi:hypothetical protein